MIREISEPSPDIGRGYIINIIIWLGGGISTVCVVLRVYSRLYIIHRPGWDDAIVGFAALLNISARALMSVVVAHGLGQHIIYLSNYDIDIITYYNPILELMGIIAYCLPKLAIVILIQKLMGRATWGIWFLYGVVAVLFILTVVSIVIIFVVCNSPGQFLHLVSPERCVPIEFYDIVNTLASAWSAFTDLALAVSPAVFLWNLQMKTSRKMTVILIMALGFFAMVAAIAKTLQLPKQTSPDVTYDIFWLYITVAVETDLVIIASCAPALPKLCARVFSRRQDQTALTSYHPGRPSWYGYQRQDGMSSPQHGRSPSFKGGKRTEFRLGRPLENLELGEMDEW
ncbi:hypothetical protein NPX13_g7183 [Xylaria arbuscula]|uniref:Rhodopsin domain-containing protein n=1 Tax=Xylaria arbuscula TaxID=114810 RepID=A0A9W8NAH0_9PEZI|nr:hypothetical protein NPX13_g7183 [Xylaria arbuscula]